jgi:hypothetical protein
VSDHPVQVAAVIAWSIVSAALTFSEQVCMLTVLLGLIMLLSVFNQMSATRLGVLASILLDPILP